jgi:hypothetical protein
MEMDIWMESYRRFWTESADRLEEHLKTMKGKSAKAGKKRR